MITNNWPTTHELARALLEMPDVTVVIQGWALPSFQTIGVRITDYSDEVAILKPTPYEP